MAAQILRAKVNKAYTRELRESLEEKRILQYLPLVRHVVQKVIAQLSNRADTENLISAGTLGLVKAARSYDPGRNTEFKTYAYIRIRGAVIDELRSESFVPSGVRKQIRLAEQAYRRYFQRNGCAPADEELAGELGISKEQLYRTLEEARRQQFLSIHGLAGDREGQTELVPVDGSLSPAAQVEKLELLERLAKAIKDMPPRDRQILLLYYERDLTMKEIAAVFDITESRVSQLHASSLFKLSMRLRA